VVHSSSNSLRGLAVRRCCFPSVVLLVEGEVSLEDLLDRAQQSLEAVTVQGHHLHRRGRYDVSCSWLVLHQRPLAKVISWSVLVDLHWSIARLKCLGGDCGAAHDQEEGLALFSLSNDEVLGLEPLLDESVSEFAALVLVHVLEDAHALQELLVLLSLLRSCVLHDVVEGLAIQRPQLSLGLRNDGRCSGSVVEQGELSEGLARVVLLQEGRSVVSFL
jgi:hypothetical protein